MRLGTGTVLFACLALAWLSLGPAQTAAPGHVYTGALVTRWGGAVTADDAWRSYPRPQLQRANWMNLNGR